MHYELIIVALRDLKEGRIYMLWVDSFRWIHGKKLKETMCQWFRMLTDVILSKELAMPFKVLGGFVNCTHQHVDGKYRNNCLFHVLKNCTTFVYDASLQNDIMKELTRLNPCGWANFQHSDVAIHVRSDSPLGLSWPQFGCEFETDCRKELHDKYLEIHR